MKFVGKGLLAIAAFGCVDAAIAADMPAKAPAPAAVIAQNWSGFYIGAHAGYAQGDQTISVNDSRTLIGVAFGPVAGTVSDSQGGGLVGIHGGYNWQFSSWVVGVEADFSWASLQVGGQSGAPTFVTGLGLLPTTFANMREDIRSIGSVRGRFGYSWDNWLAYATGGWAYAAVDFNGDTVCGVGVPACATPVHAPLSFSDTLTGYVLGGGFEFKNPTAPWVFGLEYLFYHLDAPDSRSVATFVTTTGAPISFNPACPAGTPCVAYTFGDLEIHAIRARLSYKF